MADQEKPTAQQLHAAACTNLDSKFEPLSIKLSNDAILTGLLYLPKHDTPQTKKPLIVAIHGATCSAYTWDIDKSTSVVNYAEQLGLPVLAVNRPNYLDSDGWLGNRTPSAGSESDAATDSATELTYFEEEGYWFHKLGFPAIWQQVAVPNGLSSLVTVSHSMSVPVTIIAGSLYSEQNVSDRAYPWAGMCLYGYAEIPTTIIQGSQERSQNAGAALRKPLDFDSNKHILPFTDEDYLDLMAGPVGMHDPAIASHIRQQQTPFHIGEIQNMFGPWRQQKLKYMPSVKIPILYSLGEYDYIWAGTSENVEAFCCQFTGTSRIERALVRNAPHTINLAAGVGRWWLLRVFSWAAEVAAGIDPDVKRLPKYT